MGSPINWGVKEGDFNVLSSPYYQKYNTTDFGNISASDVKTDIKACLASNESSGVVAYLSWVLRVVVLVGD